MDAHLYRLFCARLQPLLHGARIEKIQEFGPEHLAFTLFGPEGKQHLYFRFGHRNPFCFISRERVTGLPRPSAFVMRLRKYLQGGRITAEVTQVWSRRLWLMVSGPFGPVWLCLDLMRGATLHFLDENALPESENLPWPKRGQDLGDPELWRSYPMLTPSLRRLLGKLAEPEQAALLADLEDGLGDVFLYLSADNSVRDISAWPLPLENNSALREESCEDVLAAFEKAGRDLVLLPLFAESEKNALAPARRREKQLQKILKKLDQDEERLLRMTARESDALALSANLWRFARDAKEARLELPVNGDNRTIVLDQRFTLLENMERLFHEARRGKRGLELLTRRRREIAGELQALSTQPFPEANAGRQSVPVRHCAELHAPAHCQAFMSSSGYLLWRGKDARGNQVLRKLAAGHDIWVHVEQGAGAHVLIRVPYAGHPVPETTLTEAGTLAANKSWLSAAASGAVMYTEARHLKGCRSGPPGKVTIAKIKGTIIVPIDHELENRLQARASGSEPNVSA